MGVCHFCGIIILEIKIQGTCSCRTGILKSWSHSGMISSASFMIDTLKKLISFGSRWSTKWCNQGNKIIYLSSIPPSSFIIIAPKMLHSLVSNSWSCERPLAMDNEKTNFSLSHCSTFKIVKLLKDVKGSWPQHISSNSVTFLRENISKAGKTTLAITNSLELTIYLLGSKDLGTNIFRTLICNVGKPWSKHLLVLFRLDQSVCVVCKVRIEWL